MSRVLALTFVLGFLALGYVHAYSIKKFLLRSSCQRAAASSVPRWPFYLGLALDTPSTTVLKPLYITWPTLQPGMRDQQPELSLPHSPYHVDTWGFCPLVSKSSLSATILGCHWWVRNVPYSQPLLTLMQVFR